MSAGGEGVRPILQCRDAARPLLPSLEVVALPAAAGPGVEVWRAEVPRGGTAGLDETLLDAEERRRAEAFVGAEDRRQFVVAHLVLRELLGRRLGQPPPALRFRRAPCPACGGPHGRPELAQTPAPVQFSLSHASGHVLVALADRPVGVDIEAIPDGDTVASVAPTLPRSARAALAAMAERDRPAGFARVWACLEAHLKAVGTGIAVDLAAVDLAGAEAAGWTITDLDVGPGLAAALALAPAAASA